MTEQYPPPFPDSATPLTDEEQHEPELPEEELPEESQEEELEAMKGGQPEDAL